MKTKKIVIAVVITALLFSAMLIVGCMEQLDVTNNNDYTEDNYQPPVGKGLIKFSISDSNARTIMPNSADVDKENLKYTVQFIPDTKTDGTNWDETWTGTAITFPTTGTAPYDGTGGITTAAIAVPTDSHGYKIIITAYDSDGTTPIAGWTSTPSGSPLTGIAPSNPAPTVSATLSPKFGTDAGKFDYFINIASLATPEVTKLGVNNDYGTNTLALDVKQYGSTSSVSGYPKYLIKGNNIASALSLMSGYYDVIITLTAANCQTRVVKNIMHVYPASTSTYGTSTTPISIPAPSQNSFTVRFNLQGVTFTDTFFTADVTDKVVANGAALASTPTTPSNTDYTFGGWWSAASGGTQWTTFTDKIYKDKVVYAHWTPNSGLNITITFVVSDEAAINVVRLGGSGNSIKFADIEDGTDKLTISLTGALTTGIWDLDGSVISSGVAQSSISIDDTFEYLSQLSYGSHSLNVSGTVAGVPYSENVIFTVTE